jgi:hypothetical protein
VKILCHVVGLSCEGFEDQMMAMFTMIQASQHQNSLASTPDLCSKSANRGNRELKRLVCPVNYDIKGGHSNRVKGEGRGSKCSL